MSADEFDPDIERLFARTPSMPDAALFTAEVEQRLQKGSAVRSIALALAGVVGGVIAVRETLTVNFNSDGASATGALEQGLRTISVNGQNAMQSGLSSAGLGGLDLGAMGGMQMFWIVAGGLIALAAAGVMRLSQEV
ncbi:hypothetical protein GCM10009422_21680 [Brevundimonas kwangchunensis]|uniref:PhnA-like protein n=1 Tax=Brevundimonas kwangchunensis TaxID=322163 RepID=A0ABN1GZW0_9CAUL